MIEANEIEGSVLYILKPLILKCPLVCEERVANTIKVIICIKYRI